MKFWVFGVLWGLDERDRFAWGVIDMRLFSYLAFFPFLSVIDEQGQLSFTNSRSARSSPRGYQKRTEREGTTPRLPLSPTHLTSSPWVFPSPARSSSWLVVLIAAAGFSQRWPIIPELPFSRHCHPIESDFRNAEIVTPPNTPSEDVFLLIFARVNNKDIKVEIMGSQGFRWTYGRQVRNTTRKS